MRDGRGGGLNKNQYVVYRFKPKGLVLMPIEINDGVYLILNIFIYSVILLCSLGYGPAWH